MLDDRPGSAARVLLRDELRLRELDRKVSTERRDTGNQFAPGRGTYHGWRGIGLGINAGTGPPYNFAPNLVPDVGDVDGRPGAYATLTPAGLLLNQPGQWSIALVGNSGGNQPGYSLLALDWPGGAWARTIPDGYRRNQVPRRVDVASGGNLAQEIVWMGYVPAAQAALPIAPRVQNWNATQEQVLYDLFLTAELLWTDTNAQPASSS